MSDIDDHDQAGDQRRNGLARDIGYLLARAWLDQRRTDVHAEQQQLERSTIRKWPLRRYGETCFSPLESSGEQPVALPVGSHILNLDQVEPLPKKWRGRPLVRHAYLFTFPPDLLEAVVREVGRARFDRDSAGV